MDASKITPAVLTEDQLDASYYGTKYLQNEAFLKNCGVPMAPVGTLTDKCNCGATPKEVVYDETGTGLVRTTDVRPNVFLAEGVLRTSELHVSEDASVAAVSGDLLYTMSGTIGYAAVIHDGVDVVSFSNTIARARFSARSEQDAQFTAAFFNCRYGYTQSLRLVSGGIQGHVMPNPFKRLPVPTPAPLAQRYIGDKVRQAERLRERARRLETESNAFLKLPEWTEPRAGTRRAYTARLGTLRSERLDAPFYDPGHEDLDALLRRRGDIELSEVASLVEARWTRGGDKFNYFEIGELDITSGILTPTRTEVAAAPSRAQVLVEPWDVLVSTVRPNRKNVGLVLPFDDSLALVASTGFAVLRFENAESAAFYHSFLRSDAATQQLMRWNSGATYPAIESDVPMRIRAPRFEGEVVQREGHRWLQKFTALSATRGLTIVATTLVEHLINGRITEADLITAQKALEAGDRCADREILKALPQSDSPDSKPLITDVDALYALLDEPEGQDA